MKTVRSALLMGVIALGAAAVIAAPAASADTVHETWRPGFIDYFDACEQRYTGSVVSNEWINDNNDPLSATSGWDRWYCRSFHSGDNGEGGLDMTHDLCRANGYREANRDSDGPYGQFCWR